MPSVLFPIADYWWAYGGFTAGVLALLALDLGLVHRRAHVVIKGAGGRSVPDGPFARDLQSHR